MKEKKIKKIIVLKLAALLIVTTLFSNTLFAVPPRVARAVNEAYTNPTLYPQFWDNPTTWRSPCRCGASIEIRDSIKGFLREDGSVWNDDNMGNEVVINEINGVYKRLFTLHRDGASYGC